MQRECAILISRRYTAFLLFFFSVLLTRSKVKPKQQDETLLRKIADLENELNQERTKYRQEYFAVEEEKKEIIGLRARMDEYERGVYGLSEAM